MKPFSDGERLWFYIKIPNVHDSKAQHLSVVLGNPKQRFPNLGRLVIVIHSLFATVYFYFQAQVTVRKL
jgi:hypothetical protein